MAQVGAGWYRWMSHPFYLVVQCFCCRHTVGYLHLVSMSVVIYMPLFSDLFVSEHPLLFLIGPWSVSRAVKATAHEFLTSNYFFLIQSWWTSPWWQNFLSPLSFRAMLLKLTTWRTFFSSVFNSSRLVLRQNIKPHIWLLQQCQVAINAAKCVLSLFILVFISFCGMIKAVCKLALICGPRFE